MVMLRPLRAILGIPQPLVSRAMAEAIALEECSRRGIQLEPYIIEQLRTWVVVSPSGWKGAPRITIDQQSGEVLSVSTLPR